MWEKENSEFIPALLRLKFDLCIILHVVEGSDLYLQRKLNSFMVCHVFYAVDNFNWIVIAVGARTSWLYSPYRSKILPKNGVSRVWN